MNFSHKSERCNFFSLLLENYHFNNNSSYKRKSWEQLHSYRISSFDAICDEFCFCICFHHFLLTWLKKICLGCSKLGVNNTFKSRNLIFFRCNLYGTVNPKISKTAVYSKSQDEEARIREVANEQVCNSRQLKFWLT